MNKEDYKKQRQRENSKRYYYEHKEQVLKRQKEYTKQRYKVDEEYRQKVLDKNKKYEEEHYDKIKESKRKSQAKYMNKKRENGEAPLTKDMIIEQLQQENKQLKEEINKISKKELKVRDMLYSIENGTLTRERLKQIEEVLFEIGDSNE